MKTLKESFFKNMGVGVDAEKNRLQQIIDSVDAYNLYYLRVDDKLNIASISANNTIPGYIIEELIDNGVSLEGMSFGWVSIEGDDELKYTSCCKHHLTLYDISPKNLSKVKFPKGLQQLDITHSDIETLKGSPKIPLINVIDCPELKNVEDAVCDTLVISNCEKLAETNPPKKVKTLKLHKYDMRSKKSNYVIYPTDQLLPDWV